MAAFDDDTIREIAKALRRHVERVPLERVINDLFKVGGDKRFLPEQRHDAILASDKDDRQLAATMLSEQADYPCVDVSTGRGSFPDALPWPRGALSCCRGGADLAPSALRWASQKEPSRRY